MKKINSIINTSVIASDVYRRVYIRICQDTTRKLNEHTYITDTLTTSKEYRVILKGNALDLPVGIPVSDCFKDGYLAERDSHKIVIKAFKADGLMQSAKNYIDKAHGGPPLEEEKKMTTINIEKGGNANTMDFSNVQAGDVFVDEEGILYQLNHGDCEFYCTDWVSGERVTLTYSDYDVDSDVAAEAAVRELFDNFDGIKRVNTVNISYKI